VIKGQKKPTNAVVGGFFLRNLKLPRLLD